MKNPPPHTLKEMKEIISIVAWVKSQRVPGMTQAHLKQHGSYWYDIFSEMNQQLHLHTQGNLIGLRSLGNRIAAQFWLPVLRMGFLGKKPIFEGLSRSSKGLWEMQTSKM